MPKKSKSSSKMKVILLLVVGLVIGIGATFGLILWSGNQSAQKNKELLQNEIRMGKLFTEVEQSPAKIGQLADGKKIAEAKTLGEEMLAKINQTLELNQTIIDNTSGSRKDISLKKQEIFQIQKEIIQVMVKAVDITNFKSPEANAIQQNLQDFVIEKQALVAELEKMIIE